MDALPIREQNDVSYKSKTMGSCIPVVMMCIHPACSVQQDIARPERFMGRHGQTDLPARRRKNPGASLMIRDGVLKDQRLKK